MPFKLIHQGSSSTAAHGRRLLVFIMLFGITFGLLPLQRAAAASTINVTTTADENGAGTGCSLREAFRSADDNVNFGGCTGSGGGVPFTINVPAGTYVLTVDELKIGDATNTNTSIVGAGAASTIIQQTVANRRVIDVNSLLSANVSVSISGIKITGGNNPSDNFGGGGVIGGGPGNTLTLSNCIIDGNSDTASLTPKGGGVEFAGGGVLTINNCVISNNMAGSAASNLGVGGGVDFQLLNNAGAAGQGGVNIINSTFTNNKAGAANSGAGGGLRLAVTTTQAPSVLTISNNTFTGNQANAAANGLGGAISSSSSGVFTAQYNRITGNTATGGATGIYQATGTIGGFNATSNWWGCNAGPGNAGCDSIGGVTANITAAPRLVLNHTTSASTLTPGGAATLMASFLTDSSGAAVNPANLSRLIGLPITFNGATRGTLSGTQTAVQANGSAQATFTAGNTSAACGAGGANALVDNQSSNAAITVQCADLTATKTNSVAGSAVTGQSWTWTINVANGGNTAANFGAGQTVLSDNLPNSAGNNYGTPTSSNPNVTCSINGSKDLVCTASATFTLAPAASFDVRFSATSNAGVVPNPRVGGACSVDPSNLIVESNDVNNACSNSVTVNKANTTTSISSHTPDPSAAGQPVTLNYAVSVDVPGAGTPTGNVTVSDGVDSCTATVATGQCDITLSTVGARSLTATYAGDANFNGSISAAAAHSVNKASTATSITSDTPDPSAPGQAVTVQYTVTTASGTPTGNVTVSDGVDSCTATVAAGQCAISLNTAGARTLTATYDGDAHFDGSTSAGESHTVNSTNTTTAITSDSPDPSALGQAVTVQFTVSVNSGTPAGNVTVSDGVDSCTATVAAGQCAISLNTAGVRTLVATYAGDGTYSGSASNGEPHTVNANSTTTTITSDSPDPSAIGQAVTVQFSVTSGAGTPTGNVTVSDGVDSCTATVAVGQCAITLNTAGARTLTATYAGGGSFSGSTSAGEPHTVNKINTATSINSNTPNPSRPGQAIAVLFNVATSSSTPTGNVTVSDGVDSCTATIATGQCALTLNTNGVRTLTATYAGDSTFNGSTSAGVPQTVDGVAPGVTINQAVAQADPTNNSPINFTVTFDEPVTGFADGDVTLNGTAGATSAVVTGGPSVYTVAVSGMTTDGTVIASIPANVATDAAGNGNTASTSTDNVVTFAQSAAPQITTQPQNQTVCASAVATFVAAASGAPAPTVQWQFSTNNGATWFDLMGATSNTLVFTALSGSGTLFRAVFTNPSGSIATNAALLTLTSAPSINTHPSASTVNAGQTASFDASASGNPVPTVQWQRSTNNGASFADIAGATATPLSFVAQASDNSTLFRAVFSNVCGTVTTNAALLTVNTSTAPQITVQPQNQTVCAGTTASFSASASGTPAPTVQWQMSTNNGASWVDVPGATSGTFSFTAQVGDSGKQFRAVFVNSISTATTNAATLTVNTSAVLSLQPANQTVIAGQTASFTAAANGNPAPTVQWQVSTNNGASWTDVPGATSNTFSFTAQVSDSGKQFRAVFTNTCSTTTSNAATLTVNAPAPITLSPATLPNGLKGAAYNQALTASNGQVPYTFTVSAGNVPPGLTLSKSGVIAGTPSAVGTYAFTVQAKDVTGNIGSRAYTITVLYQFTGFIPSLVNPPTLNRWVAGLPAPLVFKLKDMRSLNILAANSPASQQINCSTFAPIGTVTPASPNGLYDLEYQSSTTYYIYTWKTNKQWRNTCRQFILTLNDGTTHTAYVKFN